MYKGSDTRKILQKKKVIMKNMMCLYYTYWQRKQWSRSNTRNWSRNADQKAESDDHDDKNRPEIVHHEKTEELNQLKTPKQFFHPRVGKHNIPGVTRQYTYRNTQT